MFSEMVLDETICWKLEKKRSRAPVGLVISWDHRIGRTHVKNARDTNENPVLRNLFNLTFDTLRVKKMLKPSH